MWHSEKCGAPFFTSLNEDTPALWRRLYLRNVFRSWMLLLRNSSTKVISVSLFGAVILVSTLEARARSCLRPCLRRAGL